VTDLTAKAIRARNWLKEYGLYEVRLFDDLQWRIFKDGQIQALGLGDDSLIKFAEDRGWQDQDSNPPEFVDSKGVESATFDQAQEADGVEWKTTITDQAEMPSPQPGEIGQLELTVTQGPWTDGQWEWKLTECGIVMVDSGTAPTRAEARAAAVEAARGMG